MKRGRLYLLCGVLAVACAHPHVKAPAPEDVAWSAALDSAQRLASDSQYASADSLLSSFALGAPESTGAQEAVFWHGVFLLEPAYKNGGAHAAAEAFDRYLISGASAHRTEALALQRASRVIDSLSKSRTMDSVPPMHLVVSDDSAKATAREAELTKSLKTLQDSLNKTTAELERIKKRLSTGKP
ncbi:MAG: hypothetical protein JJD97_06780 [Gemmatimonadaceae bacterium]|nr:hypothetical protein [Gemmatimonadaceae bacterium]